MLSSLASIRSDPLLVGVLVVAAVGSAAVLLVALGALDRRRSLSYLLVVLAIGTLFGRTLLGGLTTGGLLPTEPHHVAEHGFDVILIVFLVGAVYAARTDGRRVEGDEQ